MRGLLLLLALCAPARAQEPGGVIFRALNDEMRRTLDKLEMGKLGKPYFVSYTVEDSSSTSIWASFGALRDPRVTRSRLVKAGVRVGNPAFDDTHYVAKDFWNYHPMLERMAFEEEYDALRFSVWSLTDEAYKSALQKFSQKRAYQKARMIKEEMPDLSKEKVESFSPEASEGAPFDLRLWQERLRKLSSIFRGYPAIQRSAILLTRGWRRIYYLDSEGRRSWRASDSLEITLEAATQADDGMELGDRRHIILRGPQGDLALSQLEGQVDALAKDLTAMSKAPLMESYIGPVLLEGQAAGEFLNQLLVHNISAPRQLWIEEEGVKDRFRSGELASWLGLRVLSPMLNVYDDPTVKDFQGTRLNGHYLFDDQGLAPKRVSLIEKGILKDVLMSRSPTKDRAHSNGHGRASLFEFPTGRPGNIFIESNKTLPASALKAELIRQAREFGLRFGLLIRRIAEEEFQEETDLLSAPILVYKVDVNSGKEELIRNAQFSGVALRALRDIIAVSDTRNVYNYSQLGPYKNGRGEVPASIVHPSLLISEMELKKTERKPEKPPYLKHPYFDR